MTHKRTIIFIVATLRNLNFEFSHLAGTFYSRCISCCRAIHFNFSTLSLNLSCQWFKYVYKSLHQLKMALHHHPPNQERVLNLSILLTSGTGEVSHVEPNYATGSTCGGALLSILQVSVLQQDFPQNPKALVSQKPPAESPEELRQIAGWHHLWSEPG